MWIVCSALGEWHSTIFSTVPERESRPQRQFSVCSRFANHERITARTRITSLQFSVSHGSSTLGRHDHGWAQLNWERNKSVLKWFRSLKRFVHSNNTFATDTTLGSTSTEELVRTCSSLPTCIASQSRVTTDMSRFYTEHQAANLPVLGSVLWQEVTYLAANTAHSFFSLRMRGNSSLSVKLLNSGQCFSICGKKSSLMCLYLWHCVRKCSSVSTAPSSQWQHSLSSLGSQVWWCLPFSIAKLWSLSLFIVNAFLRFLSVTMVRYSATVYCLFRVKYVSSWCCERVISFQ